ncbi:protein CLT1, chloroplastic isoform X1 [Cajanus cajan]|uniref:protein CLT1, chloroplastic isoform X1 n=1 Tax=Cajanus cajan TaxID=3821 RepID=UPI00098DA2AE|nr:protein CLT1, chloroplastic isoform X1 [Cajanus cajan]
MRLVAVGSGVGGGPWVSSYVGGRNEKVGQCFYAVEDRKVAVDEGGDAVAGGGKRVAEVVVAAVATVVLGVGNRVLYKLALVPLKQYPFFLAQLATFGYVIVYFGILYIRHHAGIVTDEMLHAPKAPFIVVGILEALAAATGMAAGAILSGASIPILSQTFLVWQILLSIIFLGRRYKVNQLLGCFLVTIGVVVTVASGAGAGDSLKEGGMFWTLLMIVSFFLQAADTVLKEIIFLDSTQKLKGGSMDLFVVNSYGSAFQALFICLLLPFLSKLWGIPFGQLPNYLKDGAACFLNIGTLSSGCDGAPLLPLLFIIVNIGFNIALLHLLKISSAVVSCLASTFSVPISIYVFTMPLPYLGVASSLPTGFMAGAVILLVGLLIYAWTPSNGSSGASFSTST